MFLGKYDILKVVQINIIRITVLQEISMKNIK